MKTHGSGPPGVAARTAPSADDATTPKGRSPRRIVIAGAIFVGLVLALVFARHALVGFAFTRTFNVLTGYRMSVGAFHIGRTGIVLSDVHVTLPGGDPLFDADRATVGYSLREAFPGGTHRFGLLTVALDEPALSIVRHADGSYNLGATARGGPTVASGAVAPWNFVLHVQRGEVRFIDRAPVSSDLGDQRIIDLSLDAQVHSDRRTGMTGSAALRGRRTEGSIERSWPITLGATVDYPRGVAFLRLGAVQLPVRGLIGYVQHSSAVRVDDGVLRNVAISLFALNIAPNRPLDLHVGGTGELATGRLHIGALRQPVRDLHGRLTLTDDGVWSSRLDASVAGIPIVARGGAYDRHHPTLRLGLSADGALRDLRRIFAFSRNAPITGAVHVQTLIEAPVSNILIRSALRVDRGSYAAVPFTGLVGRVDYHRGTVVLDGLRARYGAAAVGVGARFILGGPALDSAIVATASAPGRAIPFAENLAPESTLDALTLISGGAAGYRARGALALSGPGVRGDGTFAVDERGVGEFGPFVFTRVDGSSLIGALRLERPTSRSAAWISARNYHVTVPRVASRFAGLNVPGFPPVAGVLDGELAGGGTPGAFALAGDVRGHDLQVEAARLGTGHTRLSGTLADVRLDALALDGPLGRFAGSAAAVHGAVALRGAYDGSLERLVPLTGRQEAHGAVHGNILATLAGANVVVQSAGAVLHDGSVRGVALDAASGTIAVTNNRFRLIAGEGSILGRRAVAAESDGRIAFSAPDIPSAALRGTGLPLQSGNVSAFGIADLRGNQLGFAGAVAVAGGRARGFDVSGDALVDVRGSRARISGGTGALGSTFGSIGGSIDGIRERALRYDLSAEVPLGDVDLLRHDLKLSIRHLTGSFAASLHVRGSGTRPSVDGRMSAPEGRYNGLGYRDARARIAIDPYGVAARDGILTVGSTRASIAASISAGAFGLSAAAANADLTDFNDFFDADATLAGRGPVAFSLRTYGNRIVTDGALDLRGLRYRAFALGETTANWRTRGTAIAGRLTVKSAAGALAASATIEPGLGADPVRSLRAARYDARAAFTAVDLGTWLPEAGSNLPVAGRVDAKIRLAGRATHLATDADVTLSNATIAGFDVPRAHVRGSSLGSQIRIDESDADLGFASLAGSGRLGLSGGDPLAFDLRVKTSDVGPALRALVPAARGLDIAGALEADVRAGGTRALPKIQGGFDLENARYRGFVVPRAIGSLALTGNAVELRDADVEFSRGQAFVAGSLPLLLAPFGLGPPHAPVSFDVTARGVDLAQFAPVLPTGTKLAGTVDGHFGVEGSVDRPRLFGALAVTGGSYVSPLERAAIEHVGANLSFSGNSVALQAFHADVGGGTLDGRGRITLPFGDAPRIPYRAEVTAKAAKLDFPAYGRGTIDGRVELTGGTQPLVTGDVVLRDAVVPVSAVYGTTLSAAGAPTGAAPFFVNPAFRLHVTAANDVRVRSSIVDIGVTGAVDLTGTLRTPQLAGGFTATDGTISSYNHVFRIVNATVGFNPADGVTPTIEARAISRVTNPDPDPSRNIAGSANIIVTVSGTADSNNLQITYSSDPAYSQEQIIGLLLDVPALLGAVNFNLNGGPGSPVIRGAPGETNALLPPGVTPEQVSAISFNQEVFSLLNGQFTQRALSPVERVFERVFGLSDIEFTVDYGGGIGYSLRRQIGKRDFYAFLSQTVTYPERSNLGFELQTKPFESINFSYYQQNGVTSLITNQTPGSELFSSTRRLTSVQPLGNRSGFSLNLNRRF